MAKGKKISKEDINKIMEAKKEFSRTALDLAHLTSTIEKLKQRQMNTIMAHDSAHQAIINVEDEIVKKYSPDNDDVVIDLKTSSVIPKKK